MKKSVTGIPWTTIDQLNVPAGSLTIEQGGGISSNIPIPSTKKELLKTLQTPLKKDGVVNISIKRYFCDNTGLVLDKTTIATNYKTKYPVYLWGKSDFDGSFKYAQQVSPPVNNSVFLYKFIAGESFDWYGLQGGDIQTKYFPGDLVLVFADSKLTPNLLIYIVISMNDKSYSTILKETVKGKIDINKFLYILDNDNNYNESIGFVTVNEIGVFKNDYFQPFSYQQAQYQQDNFLVIPVQFKLQSKIGLTTYIQFNTEIMNFQFNVKY